MKVINKNNGNIISTDCDTAKTFFERAQGLLGRKEIKDGEGLHILKCKSIHSFFMKFPISAIFIDKNKRVVKILDDFNINKMSGYYLSAESVIELPPNTAKDTATELGDIVEFIE